MNGRIDTEQELYTLWLRHGVVGSSFRCSDGERVVVLSPGRRNDSAGPDFLGAVLLVDGEVRTGAVEMHLREKEWFAHGHQHDLAYESVILHLLAEIDGGHERERRLRLPTVGAEALATARRGIERWDDSGDGVSLSAETLADLSWVRLLRRVTEIIRIDTGLDVDDRLKRALLRRTFDALGYSSNREPMRRLADWVVDDEPTLRAETFDEIAGRLFGRSALDRGEFGRIGRGFMEDDRLAAVLGGNGVSSLPDIRWDARTRPSNSPERRLWAAAKLTFDLFRGDLLSALFDHLADPEGAVGSLIGRCSVRMGSESLVGRGRALEIVVNAALPVALAGGILLERPTLIEGACRSYRLAPTLGSNRIVREIERSYLDGQRLQGGFWQQGAIELHQRYRSSDRSGLSFVAERNRQS